MLALTTLCSRWLSDKGCRVWRGQEQVTALSASGMIWILLVTAVLGAAATDSGNLNGSWAARWVVAIAATFRVPSIYILVPVHTSRQ